MTWTMSFYYQIQQMKIPLLIILGIAGLIFSFCLIIIKFVKPKQGEQDV